MNSWYTKGKFVHVNHTPIRFLRNSINKIPTCVNLEKNINFLSKIVDFVQDIFLKIRQAILSWKDLGYQEKC